MISVRMDGLDRIQQALRDYPAEQKKAMRNAINDTARDVLKANEREITSSFDRPTKIVQKAFFVEKATTDSLTAKVRLKDRLQGGKIDNTLKPHVPGGSNDRASKGLEVGLRAQGKLRADEYLVPARSLRLNQHGNITGALARKILADARTQGGKYTWAEIRSRHGQIVRGVWLTSKLRRRQLDGKALIMVAVRRPSYSAKRFDFFGAGQREARRVGERHARTAIEFALRRVRLG